jgi:hypothetical protein
MRDQWISFLLAAAMSVLSSGVARAQGVSGNKATADTTAKKASPYSPKDLNGVWTTLRARPFDPTAPSSRDVYTVDKDDASLFNYRHTPYPMQPWAKEKFDYNKDPDNEYYNGRTELNPYDEQCAPDGPTGLWQENYPFEIIQTPKRVLIMFETNHEIRQIWTDGRSHPKDFGHNWMGHSIGKWEGDVLVIDTIGLNDIPLLDRAGHVHSDALHIVERLQRTSQGVLEVNIQFDDPKAFTMPWDGARRRFQLEPKWDIEEQVTCEDRFIGKGVPLR